MKARIPKLKPEEAQLAYYMSELSEQSYCAGWMDGLEYVLWSTVTSGRRNFGVMRITDEEIAKLKELSDGCGGWIVFDDEKAETFVPLGDWLRIYEANQLPDWAK